MRIALVALVVAAACLAGCTQAPAPAPSASDFSDLKVQATATTGILLGVVVDEAIRPIPGATVALGKPDGGNATQKTDSQGRFAFDALPAGTYIVRVTHPLFGSVQTSAEVLAGVDEPKALRLQMQHLFSQTAYSEITKFDGYLSCSISFPVGTTCVNDYTRLVGGTVPGCEGGCLKQYNVSKTAGNTREYVTTVSPGWQVIVMEAYWEPSQQLNKGLTMSVSFFTRPDSGHFYGNTNGPSPLRLEFDVNQTAEGQQEDPKMIPWQGANDLFILYNDGGGAGSIAVNQQFTHFQTNFYFGLPPVGWSFVNGDAMPF